jgi:hypothetical protein
MNSSPLPPTRRRIKRIAPLQLGKMLAVGYGLLGLIFIPFFLLTTIASSRLPAEQRTGFMAMGVGFALFAPILYAGFGFIAGVIGAAIYNLVARWVGGIDVEVE